MRVAKRPDPIPYVYKGPAQADADWQQVRQEFDRFNDLYREVKGWERLSEEELRRSLAGAGRMTSLVGALNVGDELPTREVLGSWLRRNWPLMRDRGAITDSERVLVEAAWALAKAGRNPAKFVDEMGVPLTRWMRNLTDAFDPYVEALQGFINQAGPRSFTYQGFKVENPDRMPDSMVQKLLNGLDYIVALFKRRGMLPVLQESVKRIVLRHPSSGESAAGWYRGGGLQEIHILSNVARSGGGKLLKDWVGEVFLHELGHHIHLSLLHPRAREEWDSAWEPVEQAETEEAAREKSARRVTFEDRQNYWRILTDPEPLGVKGNLRNVKLKGIDRMKFHAWLREPMMGDPFVTPKQLRWTASGRRRIGDFLANPTEHVIENGPWTVGPEGSLPGLVEMYGRDSEKVREAARKEIDKRLKRLEDLLGVESGYAGMDHPILTDEQIEEYRKEDKSVDEALDALELPTQYARTNEREDFAESFVAFMANPGALSEQGRYRMQRVLSLSDLYGKPIMRVATRWLLSRRVAARWLMAVRKIMWHGTGIRNLRGILKQGLLPAGTEAVFTEEFRGQYTGRSISTFGGVYLTDRFGTASGAATKAGGPGKPWVMVGVTFESRSPSAMADEDDVMPMVERALGVRTAEDLVYGRGFWPARLGPVKADFGTPLHLNPMKYKDLVAAVESADLTEPTARFIEEMSDLWPRAEQRYERSKPQVDTAIGELLRAYTLHIAEADHHANGPRYIAKLEEYQASARKRYTDEPDYLAETVAHYQTLIDAIKDVPPALRGTLARLRAATNAISELLPEMAGEQEGDSFRHNLRTTEPITYRGKNRILMVVEVDDVGDRMLYPDLIFHYGIQHWPVFVEGYRKSSGKTYRVLDRSGRVVATSLEGARDEWPENLWGPKP